MQTWFHSLELEETVDLLVHLDGLLDRSILRGSRKDYVATVDVYNKDVIHSP